MNIQQLYVEYGTRYSSRFKKEKTIKEDNYLYNKYIDPILGALEITEVTTLEIEVIHGAMKQIPRQANKMVGLLSSMYHCAISWGYAEKNPTKNIVKYKEKQRDLFIPRAKKDKLFEEIGKLEEPFSGLLFFIIGTGCRKSEAINLKWQDVDLVQKYVTFRERKNGEDHTIPLSQIAYDAVMHQARKGEYVFNQRGQKVGDFRKQWLKVRKVVGREYRVHDLRRTLGSWMAQENVSLHIIGEILGHKDNRSTQIYARLQKEHLRSPIEKALDVH